MITIPPFVKYFVGKAVDPVIPEEIVFNHVKITGQDSGVQSINFIAPHRKEFEGTVVKLVISALNVYYNNDMY